MRYFPGIREVFLGENIITQNDESVPYSAKVVGRDFLGGGEEVASMNIK